MREHRDVGEARLVDSQIELARQQRAAAGRVDDRLRAHGAGSRAVVDVLHRRGDAALVEDHVQHAMALADVGAAGRRVLQQEMVERRTRHLPGLRRADVGRDREVGVAFDAAVARHERRAPFLREAGLADEIVGADRGERRR